MRYRYFILILLFFCLSIKARGQQAFFIRGVVSKNLSTERIAQTVIKNLRSNDIIESDDLGWFTIKAAVGDTLLFSKNGYTAQKIAIKSIGDLPVSMQPVINLDEVTIKGQTKRQELSDIMKDYRSQGTYYDGKPPVLSFLTSPITGIYELFGATPNRARRFATYAKGEIENTEVDRRYNIAMVKRVTNASDSTAQKFMEYYKPSFEDMKEWNDYELIKHVRSAYDFYEKSPNKDMLDNLNSPPLVAPAKKPIPYIPSPGG
jgi:hypothetical protein